MCIDDCGLNEKYTVGKIYQFDNGHLTNDDKYKTRCQYTSFEEWCENSTADWLEIKE